MAIILAVFFVAAAPPADKGDATCPATKFTLNKLIVPKAQPKPQPKREIPQAAPVPPKAPAKPKPADCTIKKSPA